MLNKPLFRNGAAPASAQRLWSGVLQVLIAGQWAVALLACAQQDWNAIFVSTWLAFCAFASSFLVSLTVACATGCVRVVESKLLVDYLYPHGWTR